jgi:hypothetical protein
MVPSSETVEVIVSVDQTVEVKVVEFVTQEVM